MTEERLHFQAEVSRLLEIVAHSLYSEKEIFLRELISNASDACDRLRYLALTEPGLLADDPELRIAIVPDKEARTLAVVDNGVGMNREDLIGNLGTIARSGTVEFLDKLAGDSKGDFKLIGQFGVGFYSAFMVADVVDVYSRKAGETHGWHWHSDGKGGFSVAEADGLARGTRVVLHLKPDEGEYLEESRLRRIVQTYSDHIALPIKLGLDAEADLLNKGSALWTRPRADITAEQYKEFYHHVSHAFDEPWLTLHWRAEGALEYVSLLFVPSMRPFDLFDPKRAHQVKLYVRRVFITDKADGLVPTYLRFLRGVVDSEDLPLNVSRELLQKNPMLARIRAGIVRRVLSDLAKKAEDDADGYAKFWDSFGAVIKEGLYEDSEHRTNLLKLIRYRSTEAPGLVSLEDYLGRMKEGQEGIYFITGDEIDGLLKSPQLEGFRARGVEVLLMTDPVDEFWVPAVGTYKDKPFKSVTRGTADLTRIKAQAPEAETRPAVAEADLAGLISALKTTLGEVVKDVRASERLTASAVCLVADDTDALDMHLERLLKQHKQLSVPNARRVLEINSRHPLILRLARLASAGADTPLFTDSAWLLLDQARIAESEPPTDLAAFARRLASVLEKTLPAADDATV